MTDAPAACLDTIVDYARDRIAAAGRYPREGLHHRLFRMPELDLDVWFGGRELAELCESRLMPRAAGETARARAEVMVLDPTLPGWAPPAHWREDAWFSSRDFDRRLAAGGVRGFYHDAPSWQFFDPESATGVFCLPDPTGIPPWETGSPLRLFLHWAHARNGRRLTHAAAVGVEGAGALLAGASGSGKSGTALACLLHGLRCAGDDYVVVEAGEDVIAHAAFRIFKQDAGGLQRAGLDVTKGGWGVTNWHGKYEFDAMKLSPSGFARRMPVRAILMPRIAHLPRTRIEPVDPTAAALALAPSAVFQLPGDADEGFRFFSGLARRLPAYRVLLSENPAEIAETIGVHLTKEFGDAG
ncbi:MAG: serine kinase [Rhizobiales bacterium]|nr:serine kinase [Hyphomicrobiales bacterium]MBA68364.1 serine kinase [Hyphomicrobiales bacterium]